MFLQAFAVAALALQWAVKAIDTCCFVVQDEAHEVYWKEYATDVYTKIVTSTSITTLLTVYPTTTITNYKTNVYPVTKVFTTTILLTANPVSLYPNPGADVPQKTEILAGSVPKVTGGVTIASPTGFFVYSTAKVFTAPPVTDAFGNVACGTLLSFSNVPSSASACVPTFQAMNSNAAAYYDSNGDPAVEIALTAPFIHIPTRTEVQISPSEVCAQGNGTVNYGYPAQQFINHLAGNDFYAAQFPGIENCLPAGPSIKALKALVVEVDATTLAASTESASGTDVIDTTATTTTVTTSTVSTTSSEVSSTTSTSGTFTPSSTSTISISSASSPSVTAIPDSTTSPSSTAGPSSQDAITSDTELVPDTSTTESATSTATSTSTVIVIPLPVTESSSSSISTETSVTSETVPSETSVTSETSASSETSSSTELISPTSISTAESTSTSDTSVSTTFPGSSFSSSTVSSSTISSSTISSSTTPSSTISDSVVSSTSSSSDAFISTSSSAEMASSTSIGTPVSFSTLPGTVTIPTTTAALPPFSSSMKVGVPWRVLISLVGFVGLGMW